MDSTDCQSTPVSQTESSPHETSHEENDQPRRESITSTSENTVTPKVSTNETCETPPSVRNQPGKAQDENSKPSASLTDRLKDVTNLITKERDELNAVSLKDYARMEEFKVLTIRTQDVCLEFQQHLQRLTDEFGMTRQAMSSMNKTLEKKLTNESVYSWKEQIHTDPSDLDAVTNEKELMAQVARANAALAEAGKQLSKMEELAAKLKLAAASAAVEASNSKAEAQQAREALQRAKEEMERRQREEEERKRKEEEEQRKREEEERRRREEEERKRREAAERDPLGAEEAERNRLEEERRNHKNWPNWIYSVENGQFGIPIGCIIRAMPGCAEREHFTVETVSQLSGILPLSTNDELVSNIVRISSEAENAKFSEPLSIAIPHCAQRNPTRDVVIKIQTTFDGKWKELPTSEVVFEDIKDYKFVECRAEQVSAFAVITRMKQEKHVIHKRGGKVTSVVDSRVCFAVKQSVFKVTTNVTLEVQPVDSVAISDLHNRHHDCDGLVAASPMIKFTTPLSKYNKPVLVNVPLPAPHGRKRPHTALPDKHTGSEAKVRPTSAYGAAYQPKEDEEVEEEIYLLTQPEVGEPWVVKENITLIQPKNKDVVMFELQKPLDRFVAFRCKKDAQKHHAEKYATHLEQTLYDRHVVFILRQKSDDASDVILVGAPASKLESTQRHLAEKGYEYGPPPSNSIVIREGQEITLRFRGNIKDSEKRSEIKIAYNTNLKTKVNIQVLVVDTFAQKSIDCFRGFVQLFTKGLVPNRSPEEAVKANKPIEMVEGEALIAELLVNVPKPEPEAPKPIIKRIPVHVRSQGFVNDSLLRFVATELGDEWKRVATYLGVRKSRVQAIERNNVNNDAEATIYETLITWIKRVPKSANKTDMLVHALLRSGRSDLAEILRDKERDYKHEMSLSARDSYLRRGFVRICQAPHVVSDWKFLGMQLELSSEALEKIEQSYEGLRDCCYNMLLTWQETKQATPSALVQALRKCRYTTIADQTAEVMKGAI